VVDLGWMRHIWSISGTNVASNGVASIRRVRANVLLELQLIAAVHCATEHKLTNSVLSHSYGIHLRTADTVAILIVSRLGNSVQQVFFSWVLSRSRTAHFYVLTLAAFMGAVAMTYALLKYWALPRTQLVARVGKK
jgi:hypothetical protein